MSKTNGVVEDISFTNGGAGNQWTTISGVRYATYWNIHTKDWNIGDTVEFMVTQRPLWHGMSPIPHATNIRKVPVTKDNLFKAPSVVEGKDEVKHLVIYYKFDPKNREYEIKIDKTSGEKVETLTDVILYNYVTAKSHIDDILTREGCTA